MFINTKSLVKEGIKIELKIQKISDVKVPGYAHKGDAGMDLYASEECTVEKGATKIVKTGICMAIPEGYVGLIWDRSGLAAKKSMHVLAGVVDSGYRGEVGVVLKNLGEEDFEVEKNMRIAQMLIQPVIQAEIIESDSLDETSRNEGGFGSTGLE